MVVHVILSLQRKYPGIRLTVATKPAFLPVFEAVPGVQGFHVQTRGRHKGLSGLWKLHRELLAQNPDGIADLHAVLRTRILRFFFGAYPIPVAVLDKGRQEKRRLTAATGKRWKPLKSTHQRYADVLARLGYPIEMEPGDVLQKAAWPADMGLPQPPAAVKKIGLAPFAAHPGKCYPEDLIKEVLAKLSGEPEIRVFLFGGGPEESEKLRLWEAAFGNCVSVAGRGSLSQELRLISNLDLMVSMDSGNGHLAALYGVPVLTLWGVTHPYTGFAPFGQPPEHSLMADRDMYPQIPTSVYGNKVPEGYHRVMETIPPETVCGKILEILGPGGPGQARTTGERERK
ncbi:glycosyltransferase family 9 protein [Robiginitalea sp. SC105]|nr:glycosyltransferase family 9 protein [Robiginitalea sp. SC105]MBC2838250.1 glycosyltransferase family 9 protein [Robiginitalea sp. SC105]